MKRGREWWALSFLAALVLGAGCAVSQSAPPPPRTFGEVESQERGVIVTVRDIMVDRRTGRGPDATVRTPHIPVGPIAVAVPIALGGEKRQDVPGEEITVRLAGDKLIVVVQELSSPALAPGERVLLQREKPSLLTGDSRSRVVRDDDYSVIRPAR
ncbi:MAG: hypothetical protein HZA93_12215 [Verrucomicrobia bacterium]|nr:hypothetical protein [Verrucomicrobiota bacterium]